MEVRNCIGDLLTEHDCVIIAGFGGFIGHYTPARIDPVTHTFYPPAKHLLFNINLRHNDGLLAAEISRISGLSYQNATIIINDFVAECMTAIQSGESVFIPKVGRLFAGEEGTIQFEQHKSANLLPESFGLHSFISPPVGRNSAFAPAMKINHGKSGRRRRQFLTSFRKWAAILLIPLTFAALMGILKYENLTVRFPKSSNFITSILSRFSATSLVEKKMIKPQETNLLPVSGGNAIVTETPKDTIKTTLPEENSGKEAQTVTAEVKPVTEDKAPVKAQGGYVIIIGAFRLQENAGKLVQELKGKGMQALIYDRSGSGLYRVALAALQNREEAIQLLATVQSSDFPDAWLLHK